MQTGAAFKMVFALGWVLLASACGGGGGVCLGETGQGTGLCKEGWSESECDEWNEDEINGSRWHFHAGETCEERGYTYECSDGTYADRSCD